MGKRLEKPAAPLTGNYKNNFLHIGPLLLSTTPGYNCHRCFVIRFRIRCASWFRCFEIVLCVVIRFHFSFLRKTNNSIMEKPQKMPKVAKVRKLFTICENLSTNMLFCRSKTKPQRRSKSPPSSCSGKLKNVILKSCPHHRSRKSPMPPNWLTISRGNGKRSRIIYARTGWW